MELNIRLEVRQASIFDSSFNKDIIYDITKHLSLKGQIYYGFKKDGLDVGGFKYLSADKVAGRINHFGYNLAFTAFKLTSIPLRIPSLFKGNRYNPAKRKNVYSN